MLSVRANSVIRQHTDTASGRSEDETDSKLQDSSCKSAPIRDTSLLWFIQLYTCVKWRLGCVQLCRMTMRTHSYCRRHQLHVSSYIIAIHLTAVLSSIAHDWSDFMPFCDWQACVCHVWSIHAHVGSLFTPHCHNLSHSLYPCLCPCSRTRAPLRPLP